MRAGGITSIGARAWRSRTTSDSHPIHTHYPLHLFFLSLAPVLLCRVTLFFVVAWGRSTKRPVEDSTGPLRASTPLLSVYPPLFLFTCVERARMRRCRTKISSTHTRTHTHSAATATTVATTKNNPTSPCCVSNAIFPLPFFCLGRDNQREPPTVASSFFFSFG